MDIAA